MCQLKWNHQIVVGFCYLFRTYSDLYDIFPIYMLVLKCPEVPLKALQHSKLCEKSSNYCGRFTLLTFVRSLTSNVILHLNYNLFTMFIELSCYIQLCKALSNTWQLVKNHKLINKYIYFYHERSNYILSSEMEFLK